MSVGREIEFSDGKFVVDDAFVSPIMEATDGKPERFTFREAMVGANRIFSRITGTELMRSAGVADHLRRYGI